MHRRHLNIRGKSANLPAITDKDWLDLKFGIDVGVDYYALSFVRSADVIYELKDYLAKQGAQGLGLGFQGRVRVRTQGTCGPGTPAADGRVRPDRPTIAPFVRAAAFVTHNL